MTDRWRLPGSGLTSRRSPVMATRASSRLTVATIYSTFDPYKPSLLKGDFPIVGEDIFLNLTLIDQVEFEARRVPTRPASDGAALNYEFSVAATGSSFPTIFRSRWTIQGETSFSRWNGRSISRPSLASTTFSCRRTR